MMKIVTTAMALGMLSSLSGCAGFAFASHGVPVGVIYAGTATNEGVTQNPQGPKKGEACASSILGWITTGDASVATAAKAAGIATVASVDNSYSNILGIYSKYCVEVTGN